MLMQLTSEVSRLSTLVEQSMEGADDTEARMRKVERWMYSIPVAYVLTLGTMATAIFHVGG